MVEAVKSYTSRLGSLTGISPYNASVKRKLGDLPAYFLDKDLAKEMLSRGEDPLIYEVYEIPQPEVDGLLNVGCTILYPGKIGREYFFTKGHSHKKETTSEVYIGLEGEGLILIQDRKGRVTTMVLKPEQLVFIPPNTAHRSINTGNGRFVFLSIYPADSGHDYESIERSGFAKIVVERDGKPAVQDNPRYRTI